MSGVFGPLDRSMTVGSGMPAGAPAAGASAGMPMGDILQLVQIPFKLGMANKQKAEAHYKAKMQRAAEASNAARQMYTSQRNVASLENQKVLSNLDIQANQRQAEAMARVSAALSGTEGSTVDQTVGQTETNEVLAKAAMEDQIEQSISEQLAVIETASGTLSANTMKPFKSNAMKHMMGSIMPGASAVFGSDNLGDVGEVIGGMI